MHFHLQLENSLPCLSWCARLRFGSPEMLLLHGRSVEVEDSRFVEGAWSGEFEQSDFARATFFTGSGGKIMCDGVEFVTSMHTLAAVFLMRLKGEIVVSNSLNFLLVQAEDDLDPTYKFYTHDIMSAMKGIRKYVAGFPTLKGNRVEQFYFCNIHIDPKGKITRREKTAPPAFETYEAYRRFLSDQVRAIVNNAADPNRRRRYTPITTISSGFDSTASSALAKEAGCTQALTFTSGRGGVDDSGKTVAEALGLKVLEFDRKDYRKKPGAEVEFLGTGAGGEDMVMAPMAEALSGKLLFTGFNGLVWSRNNRHVGSDVSRGDPSGASMEEFRLRVGFFHLPIPYLGCVRCPDIHRISSSAAMKPWSRADGGYDKPIPCRLLQEAGVPRHLFGQKKKAVVQPFAAVLEDEEKARQVLSERSFAEFTAFAKRTRFFTGPFEPIQLHLLRQCSRFNRGILTALNQAGLLIGAEPLVSNKYRRRITERHLVFPWAASKLKDRYRTESVTGREAGTLTRTEARL
jgi:hypothetical protein